MEITKELIIDKLSKESTVLTPSQKTLSIPIILRMYGKMKNGILFKAIHVNETRIIDGHHRYISSVLANYKLENIPNYPKPSHLNDYDWSDVCFTEEEWDTNERIRRLNEEDARFNDCSIEAIERMIK